MLLMREVHAASHKTSACPAFDRFAAEQREQVEAIERAGERRMAERIAAIKEKDAASSAGDKLWNNKSDPCPMSMERKLVPIL